MVALHLWCPYTLLGEINFWFLHFKFCITPFYAMAGTNDEEIHSPHQRHCHTFKCKLNFKIYGITFLHQTHSPPNTTAPTSSIFLRFSCGNPLKISIFKIKLGQFQRGNYDTFFGTDSQLTYTRSLLNNVYS